MLGAQVEVERELEAAVPAASHGLGGAPRPFRDRRALAARRAGQLRYLRERVVRRDEDRAALHILDEERVGAPHDLVVVLRGSQQADKPQVAVVLRLAGTLRR